MHTKYDKKLTSAYARRLQNDEISLEEKYIAESWSASKSDPSAQMNISQRMCR